MKLICEKIGTSRNTGYSDGSHLHYEIQNSEGAWGSNSSSNNPADYLP